MAQNAGTRVYSVLVEHIDRGICEHRYVPGQPLPSEREMERTYGLSRTSVRRALAELEARKKIVRKTGKGTFVASVEDQVRTASVQRLAVYCTSDPHRQSFFGSVYEGILEAACVLRYRAELVNDTTLQSADPDPYAGIICSTSQPQAVQHVVAWAGAKIPVVLLCHPPTRPGVHAVMIDDRKWAARATEYLIGLGHRRIGIVGSRYAIHFMQQRILGYEDALTAAGIPAEDSVFVEESQRQGREGLKAFVEEQGGTALLMTNGYHQPIPILTDALLAGYRIPDDLSVITFDDAPNPLHPHVPSLTMVRLPLAAMGERLVELLHRVQAEGITASVQEFMPAELVIRDSCARAVRVRDGVHADAVR